MIPGVPMDCGQMPHPVGGLAGEGVFMGGVSLEVAFAGKPAPTQ
jgi:hypothetical protein